MESQRVASRSEAWSKNLEDAGTTGTPNDTETHPVVTYDWQFGLKEELGRLRLQRFLGGIFGIPFALIFKAGIRFWGKYNIENLAEIRREFRKAATEKGPLIICSNHLTYIDSALILWALAPVSWYALNYKKFSWNLPAGDHFKKKFVFRLVAFLSKCIFLHRDGSKSHKQAILNTARDLVDKGHLLTIFPEGSRSRSGRVNLEKLTFGTGKILSSFENPRVLCIYIRGDKQEIHSPYPAQGSQFHFRMEVIHPHTDATGRNAYRDLTQQVATKIKQFEDEYFASRNDN